jgi:hypothetical protein
MSVTEIQKFLYKLQAADVIHKYNMKKKHAADVHSRYISPEKIPPHQSNLWELLDISSINQSMIDTDKYNTDNPKYMFFDLTINIHILPELHDYGIVVDEIELHKSTNELEFKCSVHKITRIEKPRRYDSTITEIKKEIDQISGSSFNIKINNNEAFIINRKQELKHNLYFSLEVFSLNMPDVLKKKDRFPYLDSFLGKDIPDSEKIIEKITTNNDAINRICLSYASYNIEKIIKSNNKQPLPATTRINITNAFLYFFKFLSNYLSWLRLKAPTITTSAIPIPIDVDKITKFITQLNPKTRKTLPDIIVPAQRNLWRFLNGSILATKFTNTDIIKQEIDIFFNLNKNKDILLECDYYGIFIDEIKFDSSNGLTCNSKLRKIIKKGNIPLFFLYNLSININTSSTIKVISRNVEKDIGTAELFFSLEKENGIDKIVIFVDKIIEGSLHDIATFLFENDSILTNMAEEKKIDKKEHIEDISNAIKNLLTCLNNYLSWLRLEQIETIKKSDFLYPENQAIINRTALQKYIKYKAKYIKLSNAINKHN